MVSGIWAIPEALPIFGSLFALIFLSGVVAFIGYFALCALWAFFGREVVTLSADEMTVERSIPFYSQEYTYAPSDLRGMQVEATPAQKIPGMRFVALPFITKAGGGPIVFEDRSGKYRMGIPLSVKDAEAVVEEITNSRFYRERSRAEPNTDRVAETDATGEGSPSRNARERVPEVIDRDQLDFGDLFDGRIKETEAYQEYSDLKHVRLKSPLEVEECLRRIELTTSEQTIFPSDLDPISATIEGQNFRLRVRQRLKGRKNSFVPLFNGQVRSAEEETLIEGSFGMHPFVIIFLILWVLGFFGIGAVALMLGVIRLSSVIESLTIRSVLAILPFALFLGIGVAIWKLSGSWGKEDRAEIVYFLTELLEAEVVEDKETG